jgi:hypothetical protein
MPDNDQSRPNHRAAFMDDQPIYASNCTARNLWQKYEIFADRLELHTHLGNFVIPLDQVKGAEVYPPVLKSLRLHLRKCLPIGIKLDTTDISEHILLDKKSGFVRHILFTPENPKEFKAALDGTLKKFTDEGQKQAQK